MNETAIFTTPLPPTTNFNWLRKRSIELVQNMAEAAWTDFNDSDPGVTIIDQLCYALTELGYCIDFPIEDILTSEDGHIRYDDQFFSPQEILTCSPVSLMDYRKLVLDALPSLRNVYIDANPSDLGALGDYHVYLFPDASWTNDSANETVSESQRIQNRAAEVLNQHRNLAEWFRTVDTLKAKQIDLKTTIQLETGADADAVDREIRTALESFVSPQIQRKGYRALEREGASNDQIFNGPLMDRGWITDDQLEQPKVESFSVDDLSAIIVSTEGVRQIEELSFLNSAVDTITIKTDQIARIVLKDATYVSNGYRLSRKNIENTSIDERVDHRPMRKNGQPALFHEKELNDDLTRLRLRHRREDVTASVDTAPILPQGRYRDINDYYSIQNTFPPEFAVGEESVPTGATAFRHAQAKQLKGYLTLFDQILANQFSQLAHLGRLFSFAGDAPVADKKSGVVSGIPYQLFPPTYYCQPVYRIPDIQPLLLGNQMYRYGPNPIVSKAQEQEVWTKYKADPFNRYVYRMRKALESDAERDDRRNRMLNHLLARHGEQPEKIDAVISAARWCGSAVQTRIILKSILLQNYRLLSYNRTKAYSTLFAERLGTPGRYRLTRHGFDYLSDYGIEREWLEPFVDQGYRSKAALIQRIVNTEKVARKIPKDRLIEFERRCLIIEDGHKTGPSKNYQLYRDGRLDMDMLFRQEKLEPQDFHNFSTAELRINLLLGLQQHYQTVIDVMLKLVGDERFARWTEADGPGAPFLLRDAGLTITVVRHIEKDTVFLGGDALLRVDLGLRNGESILSLYSHYVDQLQWLGQRRKGVLLMEPISWVCGLKDKPYTLSLCNLITILAIPEYLFVFNDTQSSLLSHMRQVVGQIWPAHVENHMVRLNHDDMERTIAAYTEWHNLLRYNEKPQKIKHAKELATLLLPKVYPDETGHDI